MLFHSSTTKSRERLAHDVINTVATPSGLIHDDKNRLLDRQKGSTHGCVLATLTNVDSEQTRQKD